MAVAIDSCEHFTRPGSLYKVIKPKVMTQCACSTVLGVKGGL